MGRTFRTVLVFLFYLIQKNYCEFEIFMSLEAGWFYQYGLYNEAKKLPSKGYLEMK